MDCQKWFVVWRSRLLNSNGIGERKSLSYLGHGGCRGQGVVWPKFTWSKLSFFSWSKVLIMKVSYFITWPNFLRLFSWSKVLIMVFLSFKKILINCQNPSVLFCQLIETFINVILSYFKILINCQKKNWRILAVDRMYCWLRNRAKN